MFFCTGYFTIQKQIPTCGDLHAAAFYVDVCLLLLPDRLELLLQNECYDDTCHNADNQGNYQVLPYIKGKSVEITAQVIRTLICEGGESIRIGSFG